MDYEEFMSTSLAESKGDGVWDVHFNGFKITDCIGDDETEAKQFAWDNLNQIKDND